MLLLHVHLDVCAVIRCAASCALQQVARLCVCWPKHWCVCVWGGGTQGSVQMTKGMQCWDLLLWNECSFVLAGRPRMHQV